MINARKWLAVALLLMAGAASAQSDQRPQAVRNVVLVHGSFVDGSGWQAVYNILKKDGFHVSVVQEPLTDLAEDVAATRRIIDLQDGPVVLVGHSYAGAVITQAGIDPKVRSLVYVAAFQPDANESIGQLTSRFAPPNQAVRSTNDGFLYVDPAKFHETIAADLPLAATIFLADAQQLIAAKAFGEPVSAAAWKTKQSYAILTTLDHAINPDLQQWMYTRSGSRVTRIESSHAVFASHPDTVAHVIEAAAGKED